MGHGDVCLSDEWSLTFLVLNIEQLEGLNLYFLPYYQKAKLKIGPDTWSKIDISVLIFCSGHYSSHWHRITETWNQGSYSEMLRGVPDDQQERCCPAHCLHYLCRDFKGNDSPVRAVQNPHCHSPEWSFCHSFIWTVDSRAVLSYFPDMWPYYFEE